MNAFEALQRQDRRLMRAIRLEAEIMHRIAPHIDPRGETDMRAISNTILELLHAKGIEVVTDYDRAEVGLTPRDRLGWTAEEIIAYERRMLEALTAPIPPIFIKFPGNADLPTVLRPMSDALKKDGHEILAWQKSRWGFPARWRVIHWSEGPHHVCYDKCWVCSVCTVSQREDDFAGWVPMPDKPTGE